MTSMLFGLFSFNPASHGAWWVAGLMVLVLVLMPIVDGLFWLRDRYRNWRAGTPDPRAVGPGDTLHVSELGGDLRRRYDYRVEPYRRSFHEGRPNEPHA